MHGVTGAAKLSRMTVAWFIVGLAGLLVVGGCSQTSPDTVVFADASLTGLADQIAPEGAPVVAVYDPSQTLVDRLESGDEADVLITDNEATMAMAVALDLIVGDIRKLATSQLVMIASETVDVSSGLEVAGREDLDVVVCATELPCGSLLNEAVDQLGFELAVDTEEPDANTVVERVSQGDADIGFVLATDAAIAGGDVQMVDIPELADFVRTYQIAATRNTERAEAFIRSATRPRGRDVLTLAGFKVPLS